VQPTRIIYNLIGGTDHYECIISDYHTGDNELMTGLMTVTGITGVNVFGVR
jgi:hypothetical protein